MTENDLAGKLDQILCERLKAAQLPRWNGLRQAASRVIRGIRARLGKQPDPAPPESAPCLCEIVARIRALPQHVLDPLRRYYVFREAEESICLSIKISSREFRLFLRDAAEYIFMQRERLPEFDQRRSQERDRT